MALICVCTACVSDPQHEGTLTGYVNGKCRCPACSAAAKAYNRNRKRQVAYGRWETYIDAQPVRDHIQILRAAGLGAPTIADRAGVSRGVLDSVLYGKPHRNMPPSKRMRPEAAMKILAVTVDAPKPPGAQVNSLGSQRRLQALVARGWPRARLTVFLGMERSARCFNLTVAGDKYLVLASTAVAVRELYDRLWNQDPREHGVIPHSYARAVNFARSQGWASPGCWDDDTIDDPLAFPEWTGRCGTRAGYDLHYRDRILPACPPCREARQAERAERVPA